MSMPIMPQGPSTHPQPGTITLLPLTSSLLEDIESRSMGEASPQSNFYTGHA